MKHLLIYISLFISLYSCFNWSITSTNHTNTSSQRNIVHGRNKICNPTQNVINIFIDNNFTALQASWIEESLLGLRRFGLRHKIITSLNGELIDLTIRRWTNSYQNTNICYNSRIGEYHQNTDFVLIDPNCSYSQQQFMAIVLHETGHWLSMYHVCKTNGQTTDVCSTIGLGYAVMNPYLEMDHVITPTILDIREFERARSGICF